MSEEKSKTTRTRRRKTHEGTIDVKRVQYQNGELVSEEESVETIKVPNFPGEVGRIGVRGSITRNMGDFNSVRMEVGFDLPCLPELSEAQRVYEICSKFVEDKLKEEVEIATVGRSPHEELEVIQENGGSGIKRRILF